MIDKYDISKELDYLLASYSFKNKPQIQRLLKYLVEHMLDDSEAAYDQRAIAVESLGRSEDFDPAENPVVRIEIGRLRKLLNSFYNEEPLRSLVISIPLGQYRPVINTQNLQAAEKFIPKLVQAPAQPETLSLLLQFETSGEENADLYLLRHEIRIGLTVNIGAMHGVRLVVALPDNEGNVTSHVDFIVKISIGLSGNAYELSYSVANKANGSVVLKESLSLASDYSNQDLVQLLNNWGTDLLDREIGFLWSEWVHKHSLLSEKPPRVEALVAYRRYLLNDTSTNLETAFLLLHDIKRHYPEDSIISTALAELYYRAIINGSDIVENPIQNGLVQVRMALRSNAACMRLHLLLAFMMFFSKDYQMARVELSLCLDHKTANYSFKLHTLVLSCLISGMEEGLDQLKQLCSEVGVHPQLYSVMLYLRSMLSKNYDLAENWCNSLDSKSALPILMSCITHMVLPSSWGFEGAREQLKSDVLTHFNQVH